MLMNIVNRVVAHVLKKGPICPPLERRRRITEQSSVCFGKISAPPLVGCYQLPVQTCKHVKI